MVFRGKVPADKRALAIYLRQESGLSYPKMLRNVTYQPPLPKEFAMRIFFKDDTRATQGNAVVQERFHSV